MIFVMTMLISPKLFRAKWWSRWYRWGQSILIPPRQWQVGHCFQKAAFSCCVRFRRWSCMPWNQWWSKAIQSSWKRDKQETLIFQPDQHWNKRICFMFYNATFWTMYLLTLTVKRKPSVKKYSSSKLQKRCTKLCGNPVVSLSSFSISFRRR